MTEHEDEEKAGVKEEILKKFKVITIKSKKLIENKESCLI